MDSTTASKRTGKPRRSKGCTTCIQRKVKCDEKVPSCGQCLKGGRKCTGIASAIFMNMDSTTLATTSTFAPRDLSASPPSNTPGENSTSPEESKVMETVWVNERNSVPPSTPSYLQLSEQGISASHHNFRVLPPPMKDSQVMGDQFLSHFINYFAKASPKDVIFNSWMSQLPEMLASPKRASTSEAIAAASMIYYGRRTNDKTIIMEAYKSYGDGLTIQRKTLEEISQTNRTPTIEEICAPLLMSFFEICCCTSQTAYFQHLFGAAKLLEVHGPQKCSEGILFELFQSLRLQLITLLPQLFNQVKPDKDYASFVSRYPSIFCTEEWLTIPFHGREKTTIDHLVDIITICTGLLARVDASRQQPDSSTSKLEKVKIKVHAQALKTQLDDKWPELRECARSQGWDGDYFNGVFGFDTPQIKSEDEPMESMPQRPPTEPVREPFGAEGPQARQLGFYSTARMLVLAVLDQVDARPMMFESQMEAHSACILSVAEFMSGMEAGYAYLRLMLPLQLVGMLSPRPEQRRKARWILDCWKSNGGITGICEVAICGIGEEDVDMDAEGEPDEEAAENTPVRGVSLEEWRKRADEEGMEFGHMGYAEMEE